MKIKSTVWHWLAAGSLCAGLLCGMGLEGNAQVGAPITDGQFVTAMVLVLAAGLTVLTIWRRRRKRAAGNGKPDAQKQLLGTGSCTQPHQSSEGACHGAGNTNQ